MRSWATVIISCLLVLSLAGGTDALAQTVSYPDDPGYEKFRRNEQETLEALQGQPFRNLSFRLLMCQRRLREAQLMIVKGKPEQVPLLLKDYQETVEGVTAFLQDLPVGPEESADYFRAVDLARRRHQEVLNSLARKAPSDLHPPIETALASTQQLRILSMGATGEEVGSSEAGIGGTRRARIQEPVLPQEPTSGEIERQEPLYPESATRKEILQPPETPRPLTPNERFGHRLRPGEVHPRGTRRRDDSHPRPRAREPERRWEDR